MRRQRKKHGHELYLRRLGVVKGRRIPRVRIVFRRRSCILPRVSRREGFVEILNLLDLPILALIS